MIPSAADQFSVFFFFEQDVEKVRSRSLLAPGTPIFQ
jgi:hypothetical protein